VLAKFWELKLSILHSMACLKFSMNNGSRYTFSLAKADMLLANPWGLKWFMFLQIYHVTCSINNGLIDWWMYLVGILAKLDIVVAKSISLNCLVLLKQADWNDTNIKLINSTCSS
jgi:hypothetical protein